MNASPVKTLLAHGWGAGLLIGLLHLITVALPYGEGRDLIYYGAVALWAAFMLASAIAARLSAIKRSCLILRAALTMYAVIVLSYYYIIPLLNPVCLWVWAVALLTAAEWMKHVTLRERAGRMVCAAMLAWLLLCIISLCGSLLYESRWFWAMTQPGGVKYALPYLVSLAFFCPLLFALLRFPATNTLPAYRLAKWHAVFLHALALYLLAIPVFRVDGLSYATTAHHWKAFLEAAASVRSGGWLLWDVPSQYGFLQTLVVAWMPTQNVWQGFYIVNAALTLMSGYALFYALFRLYPSVAGFALAMVVSLACSAQLLPFIDSRIMPSTGAIRFLWIYPVLGYVLYVSRALDASGRVPRHACAWGNMLWLMGAAWSLESAVYVTLIWLPPMVLLGVAEVAGQPPRSIAKNAMVKLAGWVLFTGGFILALAVFYTLSIGHLPDWPLFAAYATAYRGGFGSMPILKVGIAACWLCLFGVMVETARCYIAVAHASARNFLHCAVFYAVIACIGAVVSIYIPISDDVHLVSTLPPLAYCGAIMLLLLQHIALPCVIKTACEKTILCFYAILILGTVNCFKPDLYKSGWLDSPVYPDITRLLRPAPVLLADSVRDSRLPPHAPVLFLTRPFSLEEMAYLPGMDLQPWLLPNTMVGYETPLSPGLYTRLALRRAARMAGSDGWIIERLDHPLEDFPWIKEAVEKTYKETNRAQNSEYRIRKYEKIPLRE